MYGKYIESMLLVNQRKLHVYFDVNKTELDINELMERMYVENDQIRRSIYMCCQSVKKYHNNILSVASEIISY
jgi:hypothetical protein